MVIRIGISFSLLSLHLEVCLNHRHSEVNPIISVSISKFKQIRNFKANSGILALDMKRGNPHGEIKDSNPSPGSYFERIS